jgi:hypothetical protein
VRTESTLPPKTSKRTKRAAMINDRCPHDESTPVGDLCHRCMAEGVGLVELDDDGVAIFSVPVSKGLKLEDHERLLSQEERDGALVCRKLMTDEELEEGMFEPYKRDPETAEEEALEEELVWKLSTRLSELVGEGAFYVVPEPTSSS